jgi:hypothetical protein
MANDCTEKIHSSSHDTSKTNQAVSVSSVAAFLEKLISEKASPSAVPNEKTALLPCLHRFDSSKIPQISLLKYTERLKNLGHCHTSFLIALIYIDRILAADSNFALTKRNVHRLFLTCTIVAEKFMNDDVYVNSHYAAVGGVCLREMNRLEIIVLHTLMWRLGVSPEEYNEKREDLRHSLADASSASRTKSDGGSWKEWIMVQEAVCETAREEVCEKKLSNSELSMQEAITISGSTVSGDTDFVSDSDSALMTISDIMDSPGVSWGDSGVSWSVAD